MIPIISIVAAKSGTGKTTLIRKLIPELKQLGVKVAVVKSDNHGFDMDQEGKDTWHFTQAGADAVAIVSPTQYAIIQQTKEKESLLAVARKITNVDLIIIESRAHGVAPKIEVARKGITEQLITPIEELVAVATDMEKDMFSVPVLDLENPQEIALFIKKLINEKRLFVD